MATSKIGYVADAAIACTLASLASSATWVLGRESASVDNTTTLAVDYLVSGKITVGTTPTANTTIEVWVIAPIEDTPTWPDVFLGTDTEKTVTNRQMLYSCGALAHVISIVATTSDIDYPIKPFSVASLFNGIMPPQFSLFVTHNCTAALHATGSNHFFYQKAILPTIV